MAFSIQDREALARIVGFIAESGRSQARRHIHDKTSFQATYKLHYIQGALGSCLRLRSQAHKTLRGTRGSSYARVQWLFRVATSLFLATGLGRQAAWTCRRELSVQEAVWFNRSI